MKKERKSVLDSKNKKSLFSRIFGKKETSLSKFINKKNKIKEKGGFLDETKFLKETATTREDISIQRGSYIKKLFIKFIIFIFVAIVVSSAFIVAFQKNESEAKKIINIDKIINRKTSFGDMNDTNFFTEQNNMNDRIENMQNTIIDSITKIKTKMNENTKTISTKMNNENKVLQDNIDEKLINTKKDIGENIDKKLKTFKKNVIKDVKDEVDKKIASVDRSKIEINNKYNNMERKLNRIKRKIEENKNNNTNSKKNYADLKDGKIIFINKDNLTNTNTNINKKIDTNLGFQDKKEEFKEPVVKEVDKYVEEEILISSNDIIKTDYMTSTIKKQEKKPFKEFTIDLMTSMARVTLLNGVKAPTLDIGVSNPTPVIMSIEDILYSANDDADSSLKGCFLRGSAVGNINTSRVEIVGTHLSCILHAKNGKKYKIEETFPTNKIWIKGEDGGDGVQGQIVDSSGKLLAKGASIGFLQGLSNYLKASSNQSATTIGTNGVQTTSNVTNTLGSGVSQGFNSGFDLVIAQYEKILGGYYPYIDTKGGRTNLTAVFAGEMKLTVKEYNEPNLENLMENNMEQGYK